MNLTPYIDRLQANANTIQAFLQNISPEQAGWKADPKQWSLLEVINHLYDEEILDFRAHLQQALQSQPWTPIDPESWVAEHAYAQTDFSETVQFFLNERQRSIQWLNGLTDPAFDQVITTNWGEISAGNLFHAWIAHDFLHIRQINELHYQYTAHLAKPYEVYYAGDW
ncbi:MAG: DinB family protein [Anaerolineaceae bacterium]|nr:DinB family protein [Anaerolineaceae bacterium]